MLVILHKDNMSNTIKERVLNRLTPEVYRELEKKLSTPLVTIQTTELLAGYLLGIQTVLKELRNGYVTNV